MSNLKDMELSVDVQDTKEFKRIVKEMGKTEAKQFIKKTDEELEKMILVNQMHMKEIDAAMKANSEYMKASRIKKDFEDAKRDRLKITVATTNMASIILYMRKKQREKETKLEEAEKSIQ